MIAPRSQRAGAALDGGGAPPEAKPAGVALPRPSVDDNRTNRWVFRLSHRFPQREIAFESVRRWVEESLATLETAGARPDVIERVRTHSREFWVISDGAAPPEVWCGEILWPRDASPSRDRQPEAILYPDSPWGRLPGRALFELASQTGVDHLVSHLYRWFSGGDFSEEAACSDQVRLLLLRRRPATVLAAGAVCIGLALHKGIPIRELLGRLREPL